MKYDYTGHRKVYKYELYFICIGLYMNISHEQILLIFWKSRKST